MNFLDKWNKAKFNVYESEEKTVLKILTNLSNFIGDLTKGVDSKTDLNGNHLGSWQGITRPTLSDEGMRGTVEKHINDINLINSKIDDDVVKPTILSGEIGGTITLERNKTYIVENNLTIKENSKIDGKWSAIKFDGEIVINDNVEIFNVNFNTITPIVRTNEVCKTEKAISLIIGNNVKIHNCKGDGITIYASDKSGFSIKNNNFLGGFSVGGTIQAFNNSNNSEIKNNIVHGSSHNGIAIHTSNNIAIEGNECYRNGHSGIWTPYSTKLKIKGNKCYEHSVFDGIDTNFSADDYFIDFNADSEIIENECYNNTACGITLCGSNMMVSKNKCYNNGFNGIRLDRYRSNDTTDAWGVNLNDNVVYNNNKIIEGHNISMASFVLSIIKGNTSFFDGPTNQSYKTFYLDGDNITVTENIGYKKNSSQQSEKTDTIVGINNIIIGNKFSYVDKDVNINNLNIDGNCKVKDLFACDLGNINMFGVLPIGYFKIGYENTDDGNYYLVVGTKQGNKKVQLL